LIAPEHVWWQTAIMQGLADDAGIGNGALVAKPISDALASSILALFDDDRPGVQTAVYEYADKLIWPESEALSDRLDHELVQAEDSDVPIAQRIRSLRFVGRCGDAASLEELAALINPAQPVDLQREVITLLAQRGTPDSATLLFDTWRSLTPDLRRHLIQTVSSQTALLEPLLLAVRDERIPTAAIDSNLRQRLLAHRDERLQSLATDVFTESNTGNAELLQQVRSELEQLNWNGDAKRGREVFTAHCAPCHRYAEVGHPVGPDLQTVADREPVQLLADVVLPNQVIVAGFEQYHIETLDGQMFSGVIASESANAVTLRMQDGKQHVILRSQIDRILASKLSMMPENVHEQIQPQQMADLIAFIKNPM
jgi:putative heme-binding domain-containing protein